jgi:hypothetical protein
MWRVKNISVLADHTACVTALANTMQLDVCRIPGPRANRYMSTNRTADGEARITASTSTPSPPHTLGPACFLLPDPTQAHPCSTWYPPVPPARPLISVDTPPNRPT